MKPKHQLTKIIKEWPLLWYRFQGGPDWVMERSKAEECLDTWRADVMSQVEKHSTRSIVTYYLR